MFSVWSKLGPKGANIPNVMKVVLLVAGESGNKQTDRQDSCFISIDRLCLMYSYPQSTYVIIYRNNHIMISMYSGIATLFFHG